MLKALDSSITSSTDDEQFVRRLPDNWLRVDTVLAIVIGLLSVLSLQALRLAGMTNETNVNIVLAHCIALVISALLVLYRRFPITIPFVYTAISSAAAFTESVEFYSVLIFVCFTIYSVGAWVSDRRLAFWTRLIVVVIQYTGSLVVVMLTSSSAELDAAEYEEIPVGISLYGLGTTFVLSLVYYVAAWYLGTRAWNRARDRWTLQKAYDELTQANQKVADAAVQAERLHIARELHDVIAHHVTVMGVHASAARRLVETGRETNAVVEQLEHIEASSAQAVQELQTMVYTLRDQDGSTEPLPDLSQLPELVRQADSTTQSVTCEVTGEPVEVSAAVELTLYRVAQEALSNARKHAGDDVKVHVHLHYGASEIVLSVVDDGKEYVPMSNGTGTGIQGMQERVHAVDGTLEYGPRTPYGWKVVVRVPLCDVE